MHFKPTNSREEVKRMQDDVEMWVNGRVEAVKLAAARLSELDSKLAIRLKNEFDRELKKKNDSYKRDIKQLRDEYDRSMKAAKFSHEKEVLKRAYTFMTTARQKTLKTDAERVFNRSIAKIDAAVEAAKKRPK